jgi:hypothetical protein
MNVTIDKNHIECQHDEHEDCLICRECGQCREDLDSDDLCMDCGGKDERIVDRLPGKERSD